MRSPPRSRRTSSVHRRTATAELYKSLRDQELHALRGQSTGAHLMTAAALLDELVLSDQFAEFLTLPAYRHLY